MSPVRTTGLEGLWSRKNSRKRLRAAAYPLHWSIEKRCSAPIRLSAGPTITCCARTFHRAAADAVRSRIDWKYLLCLELDDAGFDYSVLCEFRARLLEGGAQRRLFDKLLELLRSRKLVKARGRQRTDSTHVLAAIRGLNRLECVIETLRH